MSYIPSSVMKHAGPLHHDEHSPQKSDRQGRHRPGGLGTGAWLAIGGTILASAAAAIALPLIRGGKTKAASRSAAKTTRKRKKAPAAKAA